VSVRIYIEGGGDTSISKETLRIAFGRLFSKVFAAGFNSPKPITCGTRRHAFERFQSDLTRRINDHCILLVDSETMVTTQSSVWEHLSARDNWQKPASAMPEQAHLMVQCMESWFLADKDALDKYFGADFRLDSLPQNPNVEQISKSDVLQKLDHAAKPTTKAGYHKTRDGPKILEELDPRNVRKGSMHADRFFQTLEKHCGVRERQ
jgi:hypothetical protein